jgi:drug/metabolite transporter (DMT)-like permease
MSTTVSASVSSRAQAPLAAGITAVIAAMGHGLMTWAQRRLDTTVASLLQLATPVVAAVGAYLVHHQPLRPLQLMGAVVVLTGAVVACVAPTARRKDPM